MCVKGSGVDQLAPRRRGATERRAIPSVHCANQQPQSEEEAGKLNFREHETTALNCRRDPFFTTRIRRETWVHSAAGVEWLLCDSVEELFPNPD